jgi:voltage-gated potassium channel Kch
MSAKHGNLAARIASGLTALAHRRAPHIRWGALAILAAIWFWAGYVGWLATDSKDAPVGPLDAVYRTIGALTFQDGYDSVPNLELGIARYVGMLVPLVGLLFAFSGQLGSSFARLFGIGAAGHVVIAGSDRAALCLARDCAAHGDVAVLIAPDLPDETAWSLHHAGVMIVPGDATQTEALRTARAAHASHVVAIAADDTANLRIEAATRALAARHKHGKRKLAVDVGLRSPILLQEAREMRGVLHKEGDTIEARPFSLDELAARNLLQRQGAIMMSAAEGQDHDRPHLLMFGFDDAAEAVAVRALMSLWSSHFEGPRITVVTPNPGEAQDRFDARYPQARAHDTWKADIVFKAFDWRLRAVTQGFLQDIAAERGPASFILVSTGVDAENIALALGVLRACNLGLSSEPGGAQWAVPIYMKEDSESEFSRQFAVGDRTKEKDAYLLAFGSVERVATRAMILDGALDTGAAMAHNFYQRGLAERGHMPAKELEAARRSWSDVAETYRNANRAVADHAMMKLWDLGWQAAPAGVKGETAPEVSNAEIMKVAEMEHARWMAERLMSGWRPGAKRDNKLRVHPNLVPWDQLTDADKAKDADQVRAAIQLARAMHKNGFVRRTPA